MAQGRVSALIPDPSFESWHLDRLLPQAQIASRVCYKVAETLMQYYFHCIILMSTSLLWIAESFNLC